MNLAVWFGIRVLWPTNGTLDWFAVVVASIAFAGMTRWNWNVIAVVLGAGFLGFAYRLVLP